MFEVFFLFAFEGGLFFVCRGCIGNKGMVGWM